MADNISQHRAVLKNLLSTQLPGLKITLKKSFKTKHTDYWQKEELQIDNLIRNLISALSEGDGKRIQSGIDSWKSFLMMNQSGVSEKVSELNLKSFLGSSDGRYHGRVFTEMMELIGKMDGNLTESPTPKVNSEKSEPAISKTSNQATSPSMGNSNKEKMGSEPIIIEHPLTGDKFQIALKDFPSEMNWYQAMKACEDLGNGWRLPTLSELELILKKVHKKGKGNLKSSYYWSSTEDSDDYEYSKVLNFDIENSFEKFSERISEVHKEGGEDWVWVRAVKTL